MTVVEETSKRQEGREEKGNKMKDQREREIVVVVMVVVVVVEGQLAGVVAVGGLKVEFKRQLS